MRCTSYVSARDSAASRPMAKRVTFKPSVTVHSLSCTMSQEAKRRAFYSKAELELLALEASALCTLLKGHRSPCKAIPSDPGLRGLELRVCPTRALNMVLAQKALLKCHDVLKTKHDKSSEEKLRSLALASAKLSRWSKQVAIETARQDAMRAHASDYAISVAEEPKSITPFPITVTVKRRGVAVKRRRVTCEY